MTPRRGLRQIDAASSLLGLENVAFIAALVSALLIVLPADSVATVGLPFATGAEERRVTGKHH